MLGLESFLPSIDGENEYPCTNCFFNCVISNNDLILADKTYRLSCNLFYMYIYVFTFLLVDKDRDEEKHLLSKCKISVFVFTTCRKIFWAQDKPCPNHKGAAIW